MGQSLPGAPPDIQGHPEGLQGCRVLTPILQWVQLIFFLSKKIEIFLSKNNNSLIKSLWVQDVLLGKKKKKTTRNPLVPGEQSKQLLAQISNSLSPKVTCHVRHSHVTTRRTQMQLMQGGSPCAGRGELGTNGDLDRCRAFGGGGGSACGACREGLEMRTAQPCPPRTAALVGCV